MLRAAGIALLSLFAALAGVPVAHAVPVTFTAALDGVSESPPNASPGTGSVEVTFDIDLHSMRVQGSFGDLIGATAAAHIHVAVPPSTGPIATTVPSFAFFPLGVTGGTFDFVLDMEQASSYSASFITNSGGTVAGAESALFAALLAGNAYLNIHTEAFPGGEIRGFLQTVPEPASLALLAAGLGGLLLAKRRLTGGANPRPASRAEGGARQPAG